MNGASAPGVASVRAPSGDHVASPSDRYSIIASVARCVALRRAHPVLRQSRFLHGTKRPEDGFPDVEWVMPTGRPARPEDWVNPALGTIGVILRGASLPHLEDDGCPLLLVVNASLHRVPFHLPDARKGMGWMPVLSTTTANGIPTDQTVNPPGRSFDIDHRSLVLFAETRIEHGSAETGRFSGEDAP